MTAVHIIDLTCFPNTCFSLNKGLAKFFGKDQRVNNLASAGHTQSLAYHILCAAVFWFFFNNLLKTIHELFKNRAWPEFGLGAVVCRLLV